MKVYSIADTSHECYGHGDFGTEQKITRQGSYGSGQFPPIFKDKSMALDYLKSIKWNSGKVVVELELED